MDTAPGIAKRPTLSLRLNDGAREDSRRAMFDGFQELWTGARLAHSHPAPKDRNVAGGEMRTTLPADRPTRPRSVMEARDPEVLATMLAFYAPTAKRIVDCTANKRRMWKGLDTELVTFCDIDPAMSPDFVADFADLPFADETVDVLVFDPPHLPHAAASPQSDQGFAGRYGLSMGGGSSDISHFFPPFLREAARVLTDDGLIFAKLKDFVHNHAYRWTLTDFIIAVRLQSELTACDLIVKRDPSAGRMMSGRWKKAHHARNAHCWWVVVRKGRCEAKSRHHAPRQGGMR